MEQDEYIAMITAIASDVAERLGEDADARYQFFRRFVHLAQEMTQSSPLRTRAHMVAPEPPSPTRPGCHVTRSPRRAPERS